MRCNSTNIFLHVEHKLSLRRRCICEVIPLKQRCCGFSWSWVLRSRAALHVYSEFCCLSDVRGRVEVMLCEQDRAELQSLTFLSISNKLVFIISHVFESVKPQRCRVDRDACQRFLALVKQWNQHIWNPLRLNISVSCGIFISPFFHHVDACWAEAGQSDPDHTGVFVKPWLVCWWKSRPVCVSSDWVYSFLKPRINTSDSTPSPSSW